MPNEVGEVQTRAVIRRGCGYPKPGGVYLESQGEAGGTLPIIIVLDPPVAHDHFHRGFVYVDLDKILTSQEIKYVGSSVASAEEWHLRQKYQAISHDVFGPDVRIKNGQVIKFRDTAARILMQAGWQPGGRASAMQAARILRERAEELAPFVQATKTDAA
ncbi:hypothetical protein ANRL3_00861 [Anaerolineae bacterium]|nr:hypothetical protein ANRL3_00861 [Anaerolineae bacterium]